MVAPVIPALTDHELDAITAAAASAGAGGAGYILLRLPLEIKELFTEWLRSHAPDRADRVLNRMRAMRNGRLYVDEFGSRMSGTGVYAELLQQRFAAACTRHGLKTKGFAPDVGQFRRPAEDDRQLAFL
jgi:DNA repair photolyase